LGGKKVLPFAEAPRDLLEQATDERLAAAKAGKLVKPGDRVGDLTAGLGSDALAFFRAGAKVVAVEADQTRAELLRRQLPQEIEVVCGRAEEFHRPCELIYLDPARRDAGGRRPGFYEPDPFVLGPQLLLRWAPRVAVKLSPMFSPPEVFRRLPFVKECGVWSLDGEVKEVLAIMERGASGGGRTVAYIVRRDGIVEVEGGGSAPEGEEGEFLCRPDAAVYAAAALAQTLSRYFPPGACVTGDHGFILSPALPAPGFPGQCYRIVARLPYNPKKIRARLKDVERIEVVPQAFALNAARIYTELRVKPGGRHFLFLTRRFNRSLVFLTETVSAGA
jgi:hypothetical protein